MKFAAVRQLMAAAYYAASHLYQVQGLAEAIVTSFASSLCGILAEFHMGPSHVEVYADRTCQVCTAIAASVCTAFAASVHKASLVLHCYTSCCTAAPFVRVHSLMCCCMM